MSGSSAPDPPDLRAGTFQGRTFTVLRAVLLGLCRVLLGMRIMGLENVPRTGPLLVVANHLHNADPVLIAVAIPRPLHYMAKKELFRIPVVSWILRRGGTFPVDRGTADRAAIRIADQSLRQGIAVGMFPEGTRSRTRSLKAALPGAAMIAQLTDAPVLPVVITGSERLPFNGGTKRGGGMTAPRRNHRGVRVRIGTPFSIPSRTEDGRKVGRDEATDRLMAELARLLPPDYRGVYAHLVETTDANTEPPSV